MGGFGPAGAPKVITPALAERARAEHAQGRDFRVNVVTGASIGASCDGELAAADAIASIVADELEPGCIVPEAIDGRVAPAVKAAVQAVAEAQGA